MTKQLDGGLILRSLADGVPGDREQLPDFYAAINGEGEPEAIKDGLRLWTRDLISGHPTVTPDDLFVVVDPAKDDLLVSATLLIPQTWRYEDITIAVGRPELVATHPDYRTRRLVRALFEAVHERSAALGHQLQVITGIPHFYRKFGYTMAVELGTHAVFQLSGLRERPADHVPAYRLRAATADDAADIAAWSDRFAGRSRLLSDNFSADELRYEIEGRLPGSIVKTTYLIIVDAEGNGVGYLTLLPLFDPSHMLRCTAYVVGEQGSYLATFDDVMHGLKAWAAETHGQSPAMLAFAGGMHEALDRLIQFSRGGAVYPAYDYAWYVRVPQPVEFLKHIGPALERRLAGSGAHGYSGALRVGFYDLTGVALTFERGRLAGVEAISGKDDYDIQFPWHTFWNVVFGHHSADDIFNVLPEAYSNAKSSVLLDALFPKKPSWLRGLA